MKDSSRITDMRECRYLITKPLWFIAREYRWSSWEYIKRFGRSPAFGAIVFYPLVSGIIALNRSVVGLPIFGSSFAISPEQAVRIYMLYFSLLSLFLGSVLYAFRCPEFFKRYENGLMYVNSEIDVLTLPAPAREVLKQVKARHNQHMADVSFLHRSSCERLKHAIGNMEQRLESSTNIQKEDVAEFMVAHWLFMTRSYPINRALILIFYAIGGILISLNAVVSVFGVVYGLG